MRDGLSLLDRLISTGMDPLSVELLEDFLGRPNAETTQQAAYLSEISPVNHMHPGFAAIVLQMHDARTGEAGYDDR